MKVNMGCVNRLLTFFLISLTVFEPAFAFTLDEFDENSDSSEVELFEECRRPTPFPMDVNSHTVNPVYLRPHPHLRNYIPPKPKNGGRPKIIPNPRTFMPRVVPFPCPRRPILPSPTNSYFYSIDGPFFRVWRIQHSISNEKLRS